MIFVDTGAWYAYSDKRDADHAKAVAWYDVNDEYLLTTDFVIDELLTLLRARDRRNTSIDLGVKMFAEELAQVVYLTQDQINRAWEVYRKFADKEWSFTDCTSKVVMEDLQITTAFTFDHHFRQFGNITVVP